MKKIRKQANTTKTNTENFKFLKPRTLTLITLLCLIVVMVSVNVTSAATGDVIYVNGTSGNDSWNGTSWDTAKLSIKNATGTVNTNGTVNIADGTYTGSDNKGITINKNMTITGQSQNGTIIDAGGSGRIFTINSGINVTIQKLTMTNGNATGGGGAIYNNGALTVTGSTFTNNTATNWGGAIVNEGGNLNVSGSTFTNNRAASYQGGAIYSYRGTLNVSGSTFTNNTAGLGGAIQKSGTLNVTNSTFTGNNANDRGGAISNYAGTSGIHFSRFVGNTASSAQDIYGGSGSVDATNNWWGSDSDPSSRVSGDVTVNPWLTSDPGPHLMFVNDNSGNDTNDGSDPYHAKKTIGNATANVAIGGTVYIADGTYAGVGNRNISITKNMTIIGASQNGTIIDGGNTIQIFKINSPITVTIQNLTLRNGNLSGGDGGAIWNVNSNLTVIGVNFTGNNATYGGAIYNYEGNLTVSGSTFTNNTANSGGAICNNGALTMSSSTFAGNNANYYGGAIYNEVGTSDVHYSHIIGNTRLDIYSNVGSIDAAYNWWGSNDDPSSRVSSGVTVGPWLVLTVAADPDSVLVGSNSTITADLQHDSNGVYHDPANGHVPGGIPVTFTAAKGTISPASSTFVNSVATSIFTASAAGIGNVTATVDNQRVPVNITINKIETQLIVPEVSGVYGDTVNLTANLTDGDGNPLKDRTVTFNVDGTEYTAITNVYGITTLPYKITVASGTHIITVTFNGDDYYKPVSSNGTLTVSKASTKTTVIEVKGYPGQNVTLTAYVTAVNGVTVNEGRVKFTVGNATSVYANVTNGTATFNWTIPSGWSVGFYDIIADYQGTGNFTESSGNSTLNVTPTPTSTTIDSVANFAGQNVTLAAHVKDHYGNNVKEGLVKFTVNGVILGPVNVINGMTTLNWTIPVNWSTGFYEILAEYLGTGNYIGSNDTGMVTVTATPTSTTVDDVSGYPGQKVTLTAHVKDHYGNPVKEGQVQFKVGNDDPVIAYVVNGKAIFSWTISDDWDAGIYSIIAEYPGTGDFIASSGNGTLTVGLIPTTVTVDDVSGHPGQKVTLTADVTDTDGKPVNRGEVQFTVNGIHLDPVSVVDGKATFTWTIPDDWSADFYNILAEYSGEGSYLNSSGNGTLNVDPSAGLYLKLTTSNTNPKIGETFIITYKLGNYGPDTAENITITFQMPEGLEFVSISVDSGSYTYDPATRTVTWTLDSVPVGDPYLYLTVKALKSGSYSITPKITSDTYNWNSGEDDTISINVQSGGDGGSGSSGSTVKAAGKTIPMHKTGLPVNYLLLAVLMVLSGLLVPKRK